jgi:hypothetical protein
MLQELSTSPNVPESPSRQTSPLVHRDRTAEMLHYFQQQQDEIQTIIESTTPAGHSHTKVSLNRTPSSPMDQLSTLPHYYNNAKFEDIICCPIKPLCDGSPEKLVPFLNHLDIKQQDEGWYPITFLKIQHIDILQN